MKGHQINVYIDTSNGHQDGVGLVISERVQVQENLQNRLSTVNRH